MATAIPNNPAIVCSLCFECYTIPKMLSCGHSFCLKCLVRYINGRNRTFPCPVCKHNVVIPRGGVDKFITNFSLQTMTDSLKTIDISTTKPSTSPAPKHHCPNHSKKEVEYYCQTCNLGLCYKCIFKDHKDHKIYDLECDSTRETVVEELYKLEQIIKNTIEDSEKTNAGLVKTSEKLKSICEKACQDIREETEKIRSDLLKRCKKRQQDIKRHFKKNESKLTETRQKVMTQTKNIKTDLETSRPTPEDPTLTLLYSLTKIQDLHKLCETMKTDIPPVTYVEWREGSAKVCDILGSTETKILYQSLEGSVFRFNYRDLRGEYEEYYSEDEYTSHGIIWGCKAWVVNRCVYVYMDYLHEYPQNCHIEYSLTFINKDQDKNVIDKIPFDTLWGRSQGFIDNEGQFLVRLNWFHIIRRLDMNECNNGEP